VHSTDDATGFVRGLFAQYGDAVADLEVRRASLEDTYMSLVRAHEGDPRASSARPLAELTR
jgi:ABC-2 type transport system ATP-binding protein